MRAMLWTLALAGCAGQAVVDGDDSEVEQLRATLDEVMDRLESAEREIAEIRDASEPDVPVVHDEGTDDLPPAEGAAFILDCRDHLAGGQNVTVETEFPWPSEPPQRPWGVWELTDHGADGMDAKWYPDVNDAGWVFRSETNMVGVSCASFAPARVYLYPPS